ncbi:MAG: ribose 5-phosphate isomerase B [Bacteroidales bacterium]|nr:ribose 5-phosphate isomerase B [Bacteroidales bacterium]MDZ4204282.1 ribose 5-phosphate isomerase B [Bacteroidales bacterium]
MDNLSKRIAIGSDHAGFRLKEAIKDILLKNDYAIQDFGTYSNESVDYPDFTHPVAKGVNDGIFSWGIVICGSGNGANMTANKYRFVRAALCWNVEIAYLARLHNDANIIALPARFIAEEVALEAVKVFLATDFEGRRHCRRVEKISNLLL